MSQSFDVKLGGMQGTQNLRGALKLGGEGLQWQAREGERKISVKAADVDGCEWVRTGKSHFQLRIRLSDNTSHRSAPAHHARPSSLPSRSSASGRVALPMPPLVFRQGTHVCGEWIARVWRGRGRRGGEGEEGGCHEEGRKGREGGRNGG